MCDAETMLCVMPGQLCRYTVGMGKGAVCRVNGVV